MAKGKDFYGADIAEVIEQACRDLGVSREDLDIEVLETGSAGIFGLCKKKAHIRVQPKPTVEENSPTPAPSQHQAAIVQAEAPPLRPHLSPLVDQSADIGPVNDDIDKEPDTTIQEEADTDTLMEEPPIAPPSPEAMASIQADLCRLLELMGLPSTVTTSYEDNTVVCTVSGAHDEHIVGTEGRTLDSIQYLLRKMVASHLPDKIMLSLDAGGFRERRTEELKIRAVELAEQVKTDGKTQAIPALNPSERRIVHMVLQADKAVRSRSVGDGVFKKVLIYKPGKGRRPHPKKRRGGSGGQQPVN